MQTEPTERLCSRIRSYCESYYEALSEDNGAVLNALPSFIRGPHRIEALLCRDGVAIVGYPAYDFEFTCVPLMDQRLDDVLTRRTGVDFSLGENLGHVFGPMKMVRDDGVVVFESPWERLYVSSNRHPGGWTSQMARAEAERDLSQLWAGRLMGIPDADTTTLAPDRLRGTLKVFEELLNRNPGEEEVQTFLSQNRVLLDPTAQSIRPKVKLGDDFVTDYVVEASPGEYVLIEIEPPGHPLYTGGGNPSHQLSHAQQQVEDWRDWIAENLSYARTKMPGVTHPRGRVIIGRRSTLTPQTARALRRRNEEHPYVTIETYDELISRARRTLRNMTSH